jgi:hypothetical protein
MTVEDLIAKLKHFPGDYKVVIHFESDDITPFFSEKKLEYNIVSVEYETQLDTFVTIAVQ